MRAMAMEVEALGQHISRSFNEDLERMRNSVMNMGGLVEEQFDRALQALTEADSELGLQVARDDAKINQMEVAIDEECSRILATRAPAAGDLRLIVATIKTITDLERMGDEAEKIGSLAANRTASRIDLISSRLCTGGLATSIMSGYWVSDIGEVPLG